MKTTNKVTKDLATKLAIAYGEYMRIRVADERTKAESLGCLAAVHQLADVQVLSGICIVPVKELKRAAAFLQAEQEAE